MHGEDNWLLPLLSHNRDIIQPIMASSARGQKLGPYETLEAIGAGGMGEVWKARDTRLDRIVAIKISK